MSFPQTASGLTAGLQTQYGTTTVENAAQAFWPEGFSTTAVGWSVINANPFAFDFTEVFQRPFALQFNFGGAQMVRPHGLDSFTPGLHDFETAQQAIPVGFDSATFGWPYALFDAPLTFNLVDVLQRPFALQFNFGAPQMVSGVGGQDHAVFGSTLLESPWWVQLEGWVDSGLGWTLVSRTPAWTFDLTDTGEFVPALQFNFDGPMVLAPHGWDSLQFGPSEARNLAFAAYPESIDPNGHGRPTVLREPFWIFNFVALGNPSLPIQFFFGVTTTRQAHPDGWDSFRSDQWHEVWSRTYFEVFPVGLNATQYGTVFATRMIIYPQGLYSFQAGNNVPRRDGEIQGLGFESFEPGTPLAYVQLLPIQMQGFDSFRSDRHRLLAGGLNTGVVAADCTDLTFAIDEEDERRHFTWVSFSQHDNMFYRGTPEPDHAIVEKSADGLTWQYVSSLRSYDGSAETYKRTAVQRPVIGNGVAANTLYYLNDRDRGAIRFNTLTDAAFAEYYAAGQITGFKGSIDIGDDEADGGIIFNPDDEYFYFVPKGAVTYSSFSQRQRRTRNGLILESLPRNGVHHEYSPFGYYSYPHAYHVFYKGIVYSSSVDSPSRLVLPPVAYRFEDGIMVRFKPEIPDHEFNWWTVAVDHKNDLLYAITSQGTHYPGIYNKYFWRFDGTTWTHLNTQELWDSPPTSNGIQQLEVVNGAAVLMALNSQYCLDFIDRYQEISDGFLPPPPHSTLVAMTLSYPGIARWQSFLSLEVYYPNPQVDGAFFRRQFLRGEMPYSPILFASDGETLIGTAHSQVYPTTCGFIDENPPLTAPYNTTFLYDFGCLEWFSEMRRFPQFIDATGIEPHQFGDSDHPDDTWISNWWREITLPFWDLQDAYGDLFIAFRIRYLDVFQGIRSLETGEFQVGFHQDVEVIGRDHLVFGEHEIMVRQIYTTGWDSLEFGLDEDLRVSFGQQYALMRGFRMPEFGELYVWNRTQYVNHINLCPEPGYYCGVEWPRIQFFQVLNRNRHIYPPGVVMTRFAFRVATVDNTARPLLVKSIEKDHFGPWYEQHMISYYVRYFDFDGWDSFRTTTLHTVHNAAQAIYPSGAVFTEFGTDIQHALWRWLYTWGIRQDEHGMPWVSFSPRGVQIFSNRDFLRVGKPFIDFGARYLEPEGWDSLTRWPFPVMTQKPVPRITPRWTWNEYQFGRPKIHNNTPQLFVVGRSMFSSIPQQNWVSHSPRYLEPQGISAFLVFRPHVEFRDRVIFLWGENFLSVPQQLRVENVDPDPIVPSQQTIYADEWCTERESGQCSLIGRPLVWTNVLRPLGFSALSVGAPSTLANSLIFEEGSTPPIHGHTQWGNAELSRYLTVHFGPFFSESWGSQRGDHFGIEPSSEPPKFRVHPHTIWARLDTPQQAKTNHDNKAFCEVDKFCKSATHPFGPSADGTGPWFGVSQVRNVLGVEGPIEIKCASNYNANSEASKLCHRIFMRLGVPHIENSKRVLNIEGFRSIRFGFPEVYSPITRTVRVWGSASTGAAFGEPTVSLYDREMLIAALNSLSIGAFQIENLNREVYVTGLNATQWGNNNPMVHYPRTITPIDPDMTQYGLAWISHSPRWVFMQGSVHTETDWTLFSGRMRVRNGDQHIRGYRFSIMTEWGEVNISTGIGKINPYGIAAPCVNPHVTVEHG